MKKYSDLIKLFDVQYEKNKHEMLSYLTHYLHSKDDLSSKYFIKKVNKVFPIKELDATITWDIPFPPKKEHKFTFIDLFSGIGGFRLALQELGGKCLFSSDINNHARNVYEKNFGEYPFGDITKIPLSIIPKHNILCAGFPCQPFSISGLKKGFEDTRGTLIYNVFKIIESKKPAVVFLENVKHLIHHDKGRTLKTILRHLEGLDYNVTYKVLNASDFNIPQNRERIVIIGHKNINFDFSKIVLSPKPSLKSFLDTDNSKFEYLDESYTLIDNPKQQKSGLIFCGYRNKKIRIAGVRPGTEHLSRVHKQPNRIYSVEGVHPTLPSQETSGRFWILENKRVRKLTINECYRIMGFPDNFLLSDSQSEQYKQIGNSVCIPMILEVGNQILTQLLG